MYLIFYISSVSHFLFLHHLNSIIISYTVSRLSWISSHFCIIILYLILSLYFLNSQFLLILCICFLYSLYPCLFTYLVLFSSCIYFSVLNWFSLDSQTYIFMSVHLSLSMFYSHLTCNSLYSLLSIILSSPCSTFLTSTLHWNNNMT